MTRVRDPIHDYIDLSPLESLLVDTPAYQRLRWIKQLGPGNLVYPGANHTRHEHCMGTSHVVNKISDIEHKNSLLSNNLDLDFIEILIRDKFLYGKKGETTYIIKHNDITTSRKN